MGSERNPRIPSRLPAAATPRPAPPPELPPPHARLGFGLKYIDSSATELPRATYAALED